MLNILAIGEMQIETMMNVRRAKLNNIDSTSKCGEHTRQQEYSREWWKAAMPWMWFGSFL